MSLIRKIIHEAENKFDNVKLKIKNALNLFDPIIIFPYRGYGTGNKVWMKGRVLEVEDIIHTNEKHPNTFWYNHRKIWKRYESDEIPGVEIEGELEGQKASAVTDNEGYFNLKFEGPSDWQLNDGWHIVKLKIKKMPYDLKHEDTANGEILISNGSDRFGIISDVDDTILKSAAVNPIRKLQIMLTQNAKNRVPFEGVQELYSQLNQDCRNPLFFVSGSSWNLYDLLESFCTHHRIPPAPFFLRDLGLRPDQWLKQDTSPYKKQHIIHILEIFNHLQFILIGDSGQKDPEIYRDICKEFPNRIKATYIRHVNSEKRKRQLEQWSDDMEVPLLVTRSSEDALKHAKVNKWVE
jgi:phosphatidate phosphatase APP1